MHVKRASALACAVFVLAGEASADERGTCSDAYANAQRLRNRGALRAAERELTVCARDVCGAVVASDCLRWMSEVEQAMPSVVVAVVDGEGKDVLDARVRIDDAPAIDVSRGRAFDLDPGIHRVHVTSQRGASDEDVVLREGEKRRAVRISLTTFRALPVHDEPERRSASVPLVFLGLGAASFAAAGGLGAYGLVTRGDLDGCRPDCDASRVQAVNRAFLVTDILLAVGLVAAGTGAYFWVNR